MAVYSAADWDAVHRTGERSALGTVACARGVHILAVNTVMDGWASLVEGSKRARVHAERVDDLTSFTDAYQRTI